VPGMTKGSSYFPLSLELNASISYLEVVSLMVASAVT